MNNPLNWRLIRAKCPKATDLLHALSKDIVRYKSELTEMFLLSFFESNDFNIKPSFINGNFHYRINNILSDSHFKDEKQAIFSAIEYCFVLLENKLNNKEL